MQKILLSTRDTAQIMRVSLVAFEKWRVSPAEKKGNKVLYDLAEVIRYRLERKEPGTGKYTEEKTRLTRAKSRKAELELEAIEGKYIPSDIVEKVWGHMIANCKARLLTIPMKIAAQVTTSEVNVKKTEKLLKQEIHGALGELATFDKDQYLLEQE